MAVSSTALLDNVVADGRGTGSAAPWRTSSTPSRRRRATPRAIAAVRAAGRTPTTADLAALRPRLHERLRRRHDLISGIGFIAAPGLLGDVPAWLEWWQNHAGGRPAAAAARPRPGAPRPTPTTPTGTGSPCPATPGNAPWPDRTWTTSAPTSTASPCRCRSSTAGASLGVAAADVYLRHFEAAVLPLLHRLPAPAAPGQRTRPGRRLHRPSAPGRFPPAQHQRPVLRTDPADAGHRSASTASVSAGHSGSAHAPKSRSVRATQAAPGVRVDPQEGARLAEVAEGARGGRGARPVRGLGVADLEAEAPVVGVLVP